MPSAASHYPRGVELSARDLADPLRLRENTVRSTPEWFGARRVRVRPPPRLDAELLAVLFAAPAFARATELDLCGDEVPDWSTLGSDYSTFRIEPAIAPVGVSALAQHRGLRRITALDLRNNDLDNDAARALVKSPYLDNLKRLRLLEGNRLRGKVWQQVIERFGEDVVG